MSTDKKTMFVKPADDVLVRDPERGFVHLPEKGAPVPRNAYWLRRVNDGSVVETKAPVKATSASKSNSAKK